MLLGVLLAIARLASSLFLFTTGSLLLLENDNKKSVVLWGAGLVFWSSAIFISLFAFKEGSEVSLAFYGLMRLILLVSFVAFLMRSTLTLLIPQKESNIMTIAYIITVLILDFSINPITGNQYDNMALHSVYLTLPLTIVFFSYFYTYHIQLKDKKILYLALSWGMLFTSTLLFILANSMGVDFLQRLFLLISYIFTIAIAFSFDNMRKADDNWHEITVPKRYVIDRGIVDFLDNKMNVDGKKIVEEQLNRSGYESMHKMPLSQQKIFVDNLVNTNFSQMPRNKKIMTKTKLMDILGIRINDAEWN